MTTSPSIDSRSRVMSHRRTLQNFHLVWLNHDIDQINNADCMNSIGQLQQVVYNVTKFNDLDACIEFITEVKNEKIFLVCAEELGQTIVPIIHENIHIDTIYIFSTSQSKHANWITRWFKIKGIYIDYDSIGEVLKNAIKICDHNLISMSLIKKVDDTTKQDLDTLDASFMYTQIMKEILLTIEFEETQINEFLSYCCEQFVDNTTALRNVEFIRNAYQCHLPIWWYTYDCFLYSMLNRALRLMEVDLIIKMGFFLKDLHNHIVTLHAAQFGMHDHSGSFVVYRGQGLSQKDFNNLQPTQDGLISFNNFLSTSLDRSVAFAFADSIQYSPDMIGVLFQITINSSVHSSQFANVKAVSYFQGEDEILFSMHSIFRIKKIEQIDGHARLWQVDLVLTSDNDPQLHALTEHIRNETFPHQTGWYRLGSLLTKLGEFNKAEQVCDILLKQTTNEREKGDIYHTLGLIKDNQGKYNDAIQYHEQSIEIKQQFLSPIHSDLASSYTNLGSVYNNIGDYPKALVYYEQALEISKKSRPEYHPSVATSYNNIGVVYDDMGEYSKALAYYEKALEIRQKTLSSIHPDLANSYNNTGEVYWNLGEYSKALLYYEKGLEISEKTLPDNHRYLATSYNNVGAVYDKIGEYSKALAYYEKTLDISQKTLPDNHPLLANLYNNIGSVYNNTREYSRALSSHQKALAIRLQSEPQHPPLLALSYNNIGLVYNNNGEYSNAFTYCEKALEMFKTTLPENHPLLATSYNNIGLIYDNMGEYSQALLCHEKALSIRQQTLPSYHPDMAQSYNNIASVYKNMNDYRKALEYYERALDIWERTIPSNHPHIKRVKENIEIVRKQL